MPRRKCPKCGSDRVAPILYGLPDESVREAVRKGELVLGGCCISDDDPQWACFACEHRLGKEGDITD